MQWTEYICTGTIEDLLPLMTTVIDQHSGQSLLFLGEQLPQHVVERHERQDLMCFVRVSATETVTRYTSYTSGRLFSPQFELRWERLDPWQEHYDQQSRRYRVMLIGPKNDVPQLLNQQMEICVVDQDREFVRCSVADSSASDCMLLQSHRYYLFGKSDPYRQVSSGTAFSEARVPRILSYPVEGADRAQLLVYTYFSQQASRVLYWRCADILAIQEATA